MAQENEIFGNIKLILMEEWDPIGINGVEKAADEYDSYAAEILNNKDRFLKPDDLAEYLFNVSSARIGVDCDFEKCRKTANILWIVITQFPPTPV